MPQVKANGLQLEYETFGDAKNPAMLLIMGLACQLTHWPEELCESLAAGGYYVIRFDNRDVGLSTKVDHLGKVNLMKLSLASQFGIRLPTPYTLDDLAQDTLALMDALKLKTAHVVGVSMGGMIAQLLAILAPQRVLSLTSIMSNSGNPRLPGPTLPLKLRLISRPKSLDRETLIQHGMQTWRMMSGPGFRPDETELRSKTERNLTRGVFPRGIARQTVAILHSKSRVPQLKKLTTPTLIIHGKDDPLVRVAAAHDLARHIPGAKLEIIPGMGHDLPTVLLPKFSQMILGHADATAA
jgi:pimeloyl-ACP methyl ester carboxylesterase